MGGSFGDTLDAPAAHGTFDSDTNPQPVETSKPVTAPKAVTGMGGSFRMMDSGSSDVMREYEVEHNKFLEEKAQEERERHQKVIEAANEQLKSFYEERERKLAGIQEETEIAKMQALTVLQLM